MFGGLGRKDLKQDNGPSREGLGEWEAIDRGGASEGMKRGRVVSACAGPAVMPVPTPNRPVAVRGQSGEREIGGGWVEGRRA